MMEGARYNREEETMDDLMDKVVGDTRLSADARICIAYLLTLGPGEHPISNTHWSRLLNLAGRDRIREALAHARELGYLERVSKGNQHQPSVWKITAPPEIPSVLESAAPEIPSVLESAQPDNPAEHPEHRRGFRRSSPASSSSRKMSVVEGAGDGPLFLVSDSKVGEKSFPLDPKCEAILEKLPGGRKRIRDLLEYWIPSRYHRSLLMSIRAWLDGDTENLFAHRSGNRAPKEEWPEIVAAACEELGPRLKANDSPRHQLKRSVLGIARTWKGFTCNTPKQENDAWLNAVDRAVR
jgi:hypothetical protein